MPFSASNQPGSTESPVISDLTWPPSAVARRDNPWSLMIGFMSAILIGLIVFFSLSQNREARAQAAATIDNPSVQPTALPSILPSKLPQTALANPDQMIGSTAGSVNQDTRMRLRAPAMIVDLGNNESDLASPSSVSEVTSKTSPPSDPQLSNLESFAKRITGASAETSRASRLTDTALIAPQGTVIAAVMETAINLDLPGFVRAVVSRDVSGFDGSTVLIPRGSHLIGQYRSGTVAGQSRAFIVWSRVLTPAGVSVDIGSPASDRLGRGGLEGDTNTHFFRRFGNAILLSVVSTGLDAASGNRNSGNNTAIVIGSQQQATNIAAIALQKEIDIPNTITVQQGTPIRVFVARDLDFTNIAQKPR